MVVPHHWSEGPPWLQVVLGMGMLPPNNEFVDPDLVNCSWIHSIGIWSLAINLTKMIKNCLSYDKNLEMQKAAMTDLLVSCDC